MTESYHAQQPTKVCNACQQEKPLDAFVRRPNRYKDGYQPRCKECQNARQKEWKAKRSLVAPFPKKLVQASLFFKQCNKCKEEKPLEEFYALKKGSDERGPLCKKCESEKYAKYRQEHLEEIRDRERIYSSARYWADDESGEAYRALVRSGRDKWHKNNPQARNELTLRYIARKHDATIGPVDLAAILERDGYVCHICHDPIDPSLPGNCAAGLSFDHVIPLSKGGSHSMDNIRPAHLGCNSAKGNRPFIAGNSAS